MTCSFRADYITETPFLTPLRPFRLHSAFRHYPISCKARKTVHYHNQFCGLLCSQTSRCNTSSRYLYESIEDVEKLEIYKVGVITLQQSGTSFTIAT
ncbi:hypothetical protein BDV36DRAFT_261284 [Aspergillus pseudocaelatus]|uniref:Uncharacterized protein n=1 Tax=Aspergillus pseudocaelatus TaxID=1825620 RepID=A0ABQ6WG60_9EURO|nr:hypothetical protein BDV36DRAFT_261284 [Aspergillus pseudocaelatus]